ncbi:NADP-dependent oxidoreductase domain-containing protein [Microdochium bolleyi]|uniref:NADP-dependent oxidoreductase domain-containing protein n=1 Tax=Microdochium bolleyi TaxID=196109 RepID=A0A136JCU6_9PEZI|nr:NADP-dependent oxidoreductase domain-containing protein [Microdochium bolleyi]
MAYNSTEECPILSKTEALARLPPPVDASEVCRQITKQVSDRGLPVLVVLDDDPTGTQTCHGINVLSVWDEATLLQEFRSGCPGFFILTNSRALPPPEARDLIREICSAVAQAADKADQLRFEVVLRGDSTLRGHFPDEVEVAEEVLGEADVWVLAPFFEQGGRLTIDDVHYVAGPGDELVPAAQTPFAKDATFGYTRSNLREYIREKSKGSIAQDRIHSVTLDDIRTGGPQTVAAKLLSLPRRSVVIVNAVQTADMDIFIKGLLDASSRGSTKFIYRTGAAFVSSRLGMQQIAPLTPADLNMDLSPSAPGGLIIAGSYVPKTTEQLASLVDGRGEALVTITLDVSELLHSPEKTMPLLLASANTAGEHISSGRDVLVMTSRKLVTGVDETSSLRIGSVVAEALVSFLRFLIPRPRYVIAKGGITSSDAASKALGFRRAEIVGQACPGVPLWRCSETTCKYPDIPYVVFPGNVGERDALRDLVARWAIPTSAASGAGAVSGAGPKEWPKMQYQRLGTSGLKISRVILGCMSFGNENWEGSPWVLPEEQALPLLKKAYDVGINTWDTANTYSNGRSEAIIAKAMEVYAIPRSKLVIMSKLYYPVLEDDPDRRPQPVANDGPFVNQMGLSRKHIFEAVEGSLRRLRTSYIDVLQLHRLDVDTAPEEIMRALHDLVQMGKVLYIGASSMRCWQFARLQYTAKMRGWTAFSSMSGLYNLLYREEEREMNPFCDAEGVGLIPWSPVARGLLARPWDQETERSRRDAKMKKWFGGSQNEEIVRRVEKVAREKGCSMSAVGLAWLLKKGACPVVGLDKMERIVSVSECLSVELSHADMKYLEELYQPLRVEAI